MADQNKALVPLPIDDDRLTALMRDAGALAEPLVAPSRIKINGATFEAGDEVYPYNAAKKTPAFTARLVEPAIEYQGFWFEAESAKYANRPEMTDKFCKSFFDIPTQARKYAEDGTACDTCPFGPWVVDPIGGRKCQWKGDLHLQIIGESGKLTGEETVWTLSLPTTSIIEFKGTARTPAKGSYSDHNFMHKLGRLGVSQNPDDPKAGLARALLSYQMGGVVAEFRLPQMTSPDKSRSWPVVVLDPIFISDVEEIAPVIADVAPTSDKDIDTVVYDDLPF